MQRRDRGQDRRILNRLDRPRLVKESIAFPFRERRAEDVVDARVVTEIQRSPEARHPEREGDKHDGGGIAPL